MNQTIVNLSNSELKNWFTGEGFVHAEFKNDREYVLNSWNAHSVSVKLTRRTGFDTYYKEAYGGAVLVFEVSNQPNILVYNCYCPIWLFGIWSKKLTFKKNAGLIFKYRSEGYQMEEKFRKFLGKKGAVLHAS